MKKYFFRERDGVGEEEEEERDWREYCERSPEDMEEPGYLTKIWKNRENFFLWF